MVEQYFNIFVHNAVEMSSLQCSLIFIVVNNNGMLKCFVTKALNLCQWVLSVVCVTISERACLEHLRHKRNSWGDIANFFIMTDNLNTR